MPYFLLQGTEIKSVEIYIVSPVKVKGGVPNVFAIKKHYLM